MHIMRMEYKSMFLYFDFYLLKYMLKNMQVLTRDNLNPLDQMQDFLSLQGASNCPFFGQI